MITKHTNPVAEVRRNRELLLEKHGGIAGLHKHMDAEKPMLEKSGWKFVSAREVRAKKQAKPGGWEGKITMSSDFNEPMEEFQEYME